MDQAILVYLGPILFYSVIVFFIPVPIKWRSILMGIVLLATLYFTSGSSDFPFLSGLLSTHFFEKLGAVGAWIKTIIETLTYGMAGVYLFFVYFMNHFVLLMVGVQVVFVTRAWFKFRNETTLKDFWKKVSQYLLIRWFLGIQVPLLTAYPVLRADASQNSDTYEAIPYVWSLDNAQFTMDLNHALLVVSIPLSLAVLAWCHKRYLNQNSCKESP